MSGKIAAIPGGEGIGALVTGSAANVACDSIRGNLASVGDVINSTTS